MLAARFSVPAVPPTFVRRPRLCARLGQGVEGPPLTLVSGPAGAGKTLLVADWVTRAPVRAAWLTVEPEDNGPGVFWTYVLEALHHHGLAPSGNASDDASDDVGRPARTGEVDHSLLARFAAHLSRRAEPVVLVLDEYDRVAASAEVADSLEFVVRHAHGGLRLVVISRTEPLLPLHRYRAAGEITDIRGADLAFRAEETALLLTRHGMTLSDEGARALTERTGGWAAGLRLSILAAQHADDPEVFLKDFEAGHSTLADFLLAEVLEAQPAETQDLLLRTSVLEQIHPDLANALTGRDDAEAILAALHRANAFVETAGHSWYRLHRLFAEILRVHLRVRHPGLDPELHRRAAQWLSTAGLLAEALQHSVRAGDWELAATRFVDQLAIGQLMTGAEAERLDDFLSRMPPDTAGPAACLMRAARDLTRHDVDLGISYLRRAEQALRDGDGEARTSPAMRLSCAVLRVLAARMTGSADLAETAARDVEAAERAVPAEQLAHHPELPALTLTDLGSAQLWAGRFDAARATLCAAVRLADGPAAAFPRYESLGRLALIDLLHGWPTRAETRAWEALAGAERAGLPAPARTGVAQLVLAAVAIDRDRLAAAHTHLDQAAASELASLDPVAHAGLTLLRSRLLLARGDPGAAREVLGRLERLPGVVEISPWVHDQGLIAMSAVCLAEGRPEVAWEVLEGGRRARPGCEALVGEGWVGAGPESTGPESTGPGSAVAVAMMVAVARVRLACGDSGGALSLLERISAQRATAVRTEGPGITVPALLVRAQAAYALGDGRTAERLTARALSLARPERLRRPFLESGAWLEQMLRRRPVLVQGHDWLPIRGARPTGARGEPQQQGHRRDAHQWDSEPAVLEPLSEREQDVLRRLAQFMSTEEIATDLCLSVNTVKTHLKSVYRKLAVSRRGEAVRRARQLRLL